MAYSKVCLKSEIQPGQAKSVNVSGRQIAIFNCDGRYLAVEDACTHRPGVLLSEGEATCEDGKCRVTCAMHGANFDLETGAALSLPASKPVQTYPVRVQDDIIEIDA